MTYTLLNIQTEIYDTFYFRASIKDCQNIFGSEKIFFWSVVVVVFPDSTVSSSF